MLEVQRIKMVTDLLAWVASDTHLRRLASTGGGEYAGPCPFCGGLDRFRVQPHHPNGGRWLCRGCTEGKWRDAIAYVMRRDCVNFKEACFRLNDHPVFGQDYYRPFPKTARAERLQSSTSSPSAQWQERGRKFLASCEAKLWSSAGEKARRWLNARGLRDETLKRWRIGFNPQESFEALPLWGLPAPTDGKRHAVWLPRGIVIPCEIEGTLWYVKIRRAAGTPKFVNVKLPASTSGVALFGAENLLRSKTVVLCEGEFDAILLKQEAGDLVGVATFGSASLAHFDLKQWGRFLLPVARFFISFDVDGRSETGANALCDLSARMQRVFIPQLRPSDKDLTDFHKSGGCLRDWLQFELARVDYLMNASRNQKSFENPVHLHSEITPEIFAAIQQHEHATGCTWAEILRAVEEVQPELVRAYHDAYVAADCDIYGRWKAHEMQNEDLTQFCEKLQAWQNAVLQLLRCHAEISK